jgi:hypothetical protein
LRVELADTQVAKRDGRETASGLGAAREAARDRAALRTKSFHFHCGARLAAAARMRMGFSTFAGALALAALGIGCSSGDPAQAPEGASEPAPVPEGSPVPPVRRSPMPGAGRLDGDTPDAPPADPYPQPPSCTAALGHAVGDWSLFGNGQCLVGVQHFYPAKFGASVPIARAAYTGACAPEGACHIWLDDIPDPARWDKIANDGSAHPSVYDLIVFPPTASNPYGHIASVDRFQDGAIYVMDTNWTLNETKAPAPHTTGSYAAYGFYHLKSLAKTQWCADVPLPDDVRHQACPQGDGLYCGGNGIKGNASTLFACKGGVVSVAEVCGAPCKRMPDGQNDVCP